MTTNLEKAKNARKELLSIASDFLREWNREVDSMQKITSKNKAQSTEELFIEIMATISVRNSFGDRFNLLVQELNQIGQDFISQEYDYRIIWNKVWQNIFAFYVIINNYWNKVVLILETSGQMMK